MRKISQRQIAEIAGITEQYLSFILNQKRKNISVAVSKKLAVASKQLGLPFTQEDWAFRSHSIKQQLKELNISNKCSLKTSAQPRNNCI